MRARRDVDPDLHATALSSETSRRMPSTWCSYQSVNASSPQSCRERSSRPATCSSSRRVTASGCRKPWRRSVSGDSVSRANGSQLAAQPRRGGDREAALASRARPRAAAAARPPCRSSRFFERPRTLCRTGSENAKFDDDGVHERNARLERPRHRRAVGLRQQVVDEVEAEVDVLQAGQELVSLGLGEARAVADERVEAAAAAGQLGARVGARRSPSSRGGARAAAGAPRGRSASPCSRGWPCASRTAAARRAGRAASGERPDALGEQVGDVGVVAAEELVAALARERDLDVLGGELRDEVGRERRRVGERLVERCGERRQQQRRVRPQHELAMDGPVALRDGPRAGELVERRFLEADRERAHRLRRLLGRERASAPESTPPESSTPTGTSAIRCARTESRRRARHSSTSSASSSSWRAGSGPGRAKRSIDVRPSSQVSM